MSEIKVSVVDYGRRFLVMRYIDPSTRKQICKSSKTNVRREAERAAAKWEAELQEGRYRKPSNMTWDELKERYENEVLGGQAVETGRKVYTTFAMVDKHHKPAPRLVRDLTAESISRWSAALLDGKRAAATVSLYCRTLRTVLRWAKEMGFIPEAPKIRPPRMDREGKLMKGRPIVLEEHERMLATVHKVIRRPAEVATWQRFLNGLWWSGLRLSEAVGLSWDAAADVSVVVDGGGRAMLRFTAAGQKARRAELLPCAPEFAKLLAETPEAERTGFVYPMKAKARHRGRLNPERVGRIVAAIGEAASVLVDEQTGKYASAHDYRRAFGTRWAKRVMPATLQRLMRHKEISTTMKYYVHADADDIAGDLWAVYDRLEGSDSGSTSLKMAAITGKSLE